MGMRLLAAQAVAREAGAVASRRFVDKSFKVGFKGPQDYLTEVDGETEELIAWRLLRAFPTDGFIGEETKPRSAGQGGAVWVVDPIDGTANFARGVAHFCVSIACVAAGEVEVGVIYDPMRDELFAARRGGGARLNGASISPSRAESLASFGRGRLEHARGRRALCRAAAAGRVTGASPVRTGSGALGIAYVAAGRRGRLCRVPHPRVGLSRGDPVVSEAAADVSDFLSGDGLARGNPLIACAPGVKDALISAAAIEGIAL